MGRNSPVAKGAEGKNPPKGNNNNHGSHRRQLVETTDSLGPTPPTVIMAMVPPAVEANGETPRSFL